MDRVLHVVESFGGGVAASLQSYVASTPELEHHIYYWVRSDAYSPAGELDGFTSAVTMPSSQFARIRELRKLIARLDPQVVHAHSSFAGVYARLSTHNRTGRRVVYTPHGFSFERRDIGRVKRAAFRVVERLLVPNTEIVAACASREARLARGLGASVVYVPNVVGDIGEEVERETRERFVVCGAGRLSAARAPDFFIEVSRHMRKRPDVDVMWVGGGDEGYEEMMRAAGIPFTGWLDRSSAINMMRQSSLYIHTAAWDGFPMSLLEAFAVGLPIIARRSSALEDAPLSVTATTPEEVGERAIALVRGGEGAIHENIRTWREYLHENTRGVQRTRLLQAYGVKLE